MGKEGESYNSDTGINSSKKIVIEKMVLRGGQAAEFLSGLLSIFGTLGHRCQGLASSSRNRNTRETWEVKKAKICR